MLFQAYMRGEWDIPVATKSNWCVYCLDILRCRFVSAQPFQRFQGLRYRHRFCVLLASFQQIQISCRIVHSSFPIRP
jgi:hypothetical protein